MARRPASKKSAAKKVAKKAAARPSVKGKRLIVCSDGTWQSLKTNDPTNVRRIAELTAPFGTDGKPQIVFYDGGVGSGDGVISNLRGGAFGTGLDENIREAYRFIALNYERGDEIYLFGFSRGAYTVRSLAGMIYASGLAKRSDLSSVPEAYELYRDQKVKANSPKAKAFKKTKREPEITFLGCWDTVGSMGVPDLITFSDLDEHFNSVYEFHDHTLNPKIKHARQAAAIDEDRKVFGLTPMEPHKNRVRANGSNNQLVQLWFPGGHGGVGGGDRRTTPHSNSALAWMMAEATAAAGLTFTIKPGSLATDPLANLYLYQKKLIGFHRLGTEPRKIEGGFAALHQSARKRWQGKPKWRPKNLKPFRDDLNA